MERLSDLALFLRILDLGSISAAARSLDLSVAVTSQRLQRLERDLGVRLLYRTTRRLHPTPEGIALVEQGRGLIEDIEALTDSLHRAASEVTGTLRVTMPSSFGRQYISPILPAFLAHYPRLKLNVDLSDQVVDLVGSGFDVGIRIGALGDSSLIARRLASNRRVLCASEAYLNQYGRPRTPQELTNHECLLLTSSAGKQDIWHVSDRAGTDIMVKVSGRIQSNQGELIRDAAIAGLGIAQHSVWHVCDDLRAGRLQVVLPEYTLSDTGIHTVMPQRRLVPPRVRAFIDFLTLRLGDHPPWEW